MASSRVAADGVLVLGSAGFAGRAIVRHLAGSGRPIFALGRSERVGREGSVRRVRGSIEDAGLLADLLGQCRTIVHTASITTPGTSAREPGLEVLGNLLPLARLLEQAAAFPDRELIYLSSAGAIYGDGADGADENTALRPRSYYGAGKAAAEAFLHACTATTSWRAVSLRPTNVYGPGQAIGTGFAIVPTLFSRAIDGTPFPIWGDGSSVRDYCHVDDLARLVAAIVAAGCPAGFSRYNVASGHAASVLELIEACAQACGRPIAVERLPPRGVDVARVAPDGRAVRADFNWRATIDLTAGLADTWAWFDRDGGVTR